MIEYRFGSRAIQHQFCGTCGIKLFGRGEANGEPFVAVNVDAAHAELAEAPVIYQNGREDAFDHEPMYTRHL